MENAVCLTFVHVAVFYFFLKLNKVTGSSVLTEGYEAFLTAASPVTQHLTINKESGLGFNIAIGS